MDNLVIRQWVNGLGYQMTHRNGHIQLETIHLWGSIILSHTHLLLLAIEWIHKNQPCGKNKKIPPKKSTMRRGSHLETMVFFYLPSGDVKIAFENGHLY